MAEITLRVEDLLGVTTWPPNDNDLAFEFAADPAVLHWQMRKLWALVLLIGVRDRATSVHYHQRQSEDRLTYTIAGVCYEVVPPPHEYASAVIDAARSLFAPRRGRLARLFASRPTACATVTLAGHGVVWDAVCWSAGGRAGIELFRVTPLDPLATLEHQSHPCG